LSDFVSDRLRLLKLRPVLYFALALLGLIPVVKVVSSRLEESKVLVANSSVSAQRLSMPELNERLAAFFADENVLERSVVDRAQRAAQNAGERLDIVLAKLGLISETEMGQALARFLGIQLVEPNDLPIAPILTDLIRADFVRNHQIVPLEETARSIVLGVVNPFYGDPIRAISYMTDRPLELRLLLPAMFEKTYQALYQSFSPNPEEAVQVDPLANDFDIQRLRDLASEAPTIRLVYEIIAQAVEKQASDIHFEPQIDALTVRYRIDGRLLVARSMAAAQKAPVISRIKIMAGLDIAERRMPQDGRIKIAVRGTDIDFRVSTTPTIFGESVVLRILDRSRVDLDFTKLGFSQAHIRSFEKLLNEPNGIILVTGPTGSGKTTTLYTIFKALHSPDRKLFTVEDPIEYQLAGINQIQVHPDIGLTFPHALRSILRQDPDIIMIGEIRDLETAQIAIQASLTGHLVFSTLHTNSAAATITRLLDMGVENYLLASTVRAVLAQRLVRRLCPQCSEPHPETELWSAEIRGRVQCTEPPNIRQMRGCDACNQTGFSGRTTIAELMELTPVIQSLVLLASPDSEINDTALAAGMISMQQSGLEKVWRGETTMDEVLRATRVA
jgi:general secretion pathway protein E